MSKEQAVLFQEFTVNEAIAIAKRVRANADNAVSGSGNVTLYRRGIENVIREFERAKGRGRRR